jgi:hypothetical protein
MHCAESDGLSVCVSPQVDVQDEYHLLLGIDTVEDSKLPDAISPCIRGIAAELPGICSEERFCPQLWVDVPAQLLYELFCITPGEFPKLFEEFLRFENSGLRQTDPVSPSCLSAPS